jgi:hypothetical protein
MTTGIQSLPKNRGDVMLRRITYGSILLGVIVGGWIWQQRPRTRARPPRPPQNFDLMQPGGPQPRMLSPEMGGRRANLGMAPFPGSPMMLGGTWRGNQRLDRRPQPLPRFFANLATQAGPYVVSVRQVMDIGGRSDLYNNRPSHLPRVPLALGDVSLQVMSSDAEAIRNIAEFAPRLTYVDNHGRRYESTYAGPVQWFNNGLARIVGMPETPFDLRYLKTVEGEITLHSDAGDAKSAGKRIPFRIENVPLPVENHIFGVTSAIYLPPEAQPFTQKAERVGALNLLRETAARRVGPHFPPFTPEPNPLGLPSRLMLQRDVSNRFVVTLPGGAQAVRCTLKPVLHKDGEVTTVCLLESAQGDAAPLRASFTLWENEPVVLLCAERALFPNARENRTLALRLHLYHMLPYEWFPSTSPFPAEPSERGGSISGQVLVREEPVRLGMVRLEIERLDGGKDTSKGAVEMELLLDEEGHFRLANISPGLYRVTAVAVTPYRSSVVQRSAPEEYLSRRYRLKNPLIPNAVQDKVVVGSGADLRLSSFVITERAER